MKVLKNAKFTGNIKINDTNTDIYFQAYDDGVLQKLNAGQCSFRIKNDTGYLITISNVSTETDYITFKSNELKPLPVGTYYLELWVEDGTGTYIYPDESFCKLRINENVTVAQGTTIPTISLEEYENKLQGYVDNAVADGTQKIESDFDKYVDSITDSTIATATKASQDAATAISTANDAESAAQNATNIANAAKSNADSASQAAATAQSTANTANSKADAAQSTATDALNKATNNASLIETNSNINLANHFPDSNFQQPITDTYNTIGTVDASVINQGYGFDNSLKITTSGFSSTKYYGLKIKNMIPVRAGTVISIGALMHGYDLDSNAKLEFGIWNSDKSSRLANPGILITNNNDFTMIKYENYTIPDGGAFIELYPFIYKNGTVEITHPMLVQGSHLPNIWLPSI